MTTESLAKSREDSIVVGPQTSRAGSTYESNIDGDWVTSWFART